MNPVRKVSKLIADIDDLDVSEQEGTQSMGVCVGMGMSMSMRASRERRNVMMHAMGRHTLMVGAWMSLSHRSWDVLRSGACVLRSRAGVRKHRLSL